LKADKKKSKENKLIVTSRTENLSRIREFITANAEEAGMAKEAIGEIILAVDEACTNIIKHAYKSYPDGEITINVACSGNKFTIMIMDQGRSFEPDEVNKPDLQEYYRQRRVGGLGMYLMKRLMDDVKYISVPGQYNQVLLTKNINSAV
jgi:serine/threonine-protein kinase RsbW